ncbi:hypothetical protein M8C21_014173 [Ambrosia artemisiifolia]|uniref:Uncharacterized protein n=1 Tax=Ambrosia artemisiifolia TaxID=4212 RepID=A0AAD5GY91_AMBAR|nr:hypothetical protein M8C21_014173 [Ambrosia artemisiifolia]
MAPQPNHTGRQPNPTVHHNPQPHTVHRPKPNHQKTNTHPPPHPTVPHSTEEGTRRDKRRTVARLRPLSRQRSLQGRTLALLIRMEVGLLMIRSCNVLCRRIIKALVSVQCIFLFRYRLVMLIRAQILHHHGDQKSSLKFSTVCRAGGQILRNLIETAVARSMLMN